jgi:hypothetical protein
MAEDRVAPCECRAREATLADFYLVLWRGLFTCTLLGCVEGLVLMLDTNVAFPMK